jgi:hypothetical protein
MLSSLAGSFRRLRYRRGTLIPLAAVTLLPILFCAVSLAFWREVIMDTERSVANQVDYEDAALCIKFGFARGTPQHDACKLDLLDLRRSHADLMAQTSVP